MRIAVPAAGIAGWLAVAAAVAIGEPVVVPGAAIPALLGVPVNALRLTDLAGKPIPFQVDEVAGVGEYVCPDGDEPNGGLSNGILDSADEVVFMLDDATVVDAGGLPATGKGVPVMIERGGGTRVVVAHADPTMAFSPTHYLEYAPAEQRLATPLYTATFGRDRFHFIRAGVKHADSSAYSMITHELRIEIALRAFWGLIPIRYTEENIVCYVKRYKTGPVRLIRRGDFHLNLGLGVKGSRATVNQICYPDLVVVPVRVHLPVRFRSFFRDAYIEMTPVLSKEAWGFTFTVPRYGMRVRIPAEPSSDTLIAAVPESTFFCAHDAVRGYGWMLTTSLGRALQSGSGYVVVSPSPRGGVGHCGYRLSLTDLPPGYYRITNWVLFARKIPAGLEAMSTAIVAPAAVWSQGALRCASDIAGR